MSADLKDYREKELKSYVVGNILVMLFFTGLFSRFGEFKDEKIIGAIVLFFGEAMFSSIVYVFVFVIDSMFSSNTKDMFIWHFPRWLFGVKLGWTVFTDIESKNNDERFTSDDVKKYYSEIYDEIKKIDAKDKKTMWKKQNSEWYKIYVRYKEDGMIWNSNRDWLLCRDFFTSTLVIIALYVVASFFSWKIVYVDIFRWIFLFFLMVEAFFMWIAAKQKAKRFVWNVIAKDIGEKNNKFNENATL